MITKVLKDFIGCWKMFNGCPLTPNEDAAKKINSGDCGLAAIATHYVLRERYGIVTEINLNRNHCWLTLNGVDYDTNNVEGYPEGTSANQCWSRGDLDPITGLTFADACNEWMPCDALGGYLVKGFVTRYQLPMPAELQHCIDKAAEYECPEAIPEMEERSNRILVMSVPV